MNNDIIKGCKVKGFDFKDNEVIGIVNHIVAFGDVAIIRTSDDRLGKTEAYIDRLQRVEE